ncbi:MAG TPA: hypothetical protein VGD10_04735 [Allosphingosinicella sp.]|uniref:hypothetical protein n=1 Tax=Allosphingosinicella sp. TaxID=2823234 RepID=UPI002ED8BDE8
MGRKLVTAGAAVLLAGAVLAADGSWKPVYHSTGLDTFSGAKRAAAAARGVVWKISAGTVSQDRAVAALLAAGAAAAWKGSRDLVYFRARRGEEERIARRAFEAVGSPAAPASRAAAAGAPQAEGAKYQNPTPREKADDLYIEASVVRLRHGADAFFGALPTTVTVLPFGAGQLIRATPREVAAIERLLDEGERVSAIALAPVIVGAQLVSATRDEGKWVMTPKVRSATVSMAMLDVEGQSLLVHRGDMVLIVKGAGALVDMTVIKLK